MQPRQDYTRDNNFSSLPNYDEAFGPSDPRVYLSTAPVVDYKFQSGPRGQNRFVPIEELSEENIHPDFLETADEALERMLTDSPSDPQAFKPEYEPDYGLDESVEEPVRRSLRIFYYKGELPKAKVGCVARMKFDPKLRKQVLGRQAKVVHVKHRHIAVVA